MRDLSSSTKARAAITKKRKKKKKQNFKRRIRPTHSLFNRANQSLHSTNKDTQFLKLELNKPNTLHRLSSNLLEETLTKSRKLDTRIKTFSKP